MKSKLFILLWVVIMSSAVFYCMSQNAVFSFQGDTIVQNNAFIDSRPLQTGEVRSLKGSESLPCQTNLRVNLFRYSLWEEYGEKGDFEVIQIKKNNTVLLEVADRDSWNKIEPRFRSFTDNDYFIKVPINNSYTALLFIGTPWMSIPPYLTIIVASDMDAKLVFNKSFYVRNIVLSPFAIELEDDYPEYNCSGQPVNTPDTFRIWLENGVLMFEQILN